MPRDDISDMFDAMSAAEDATPKKRLRESKLEKEDLTQEDFASLEAAARRTFASAACERANAPPHGRASVNRTHNGRSEESKQRNRDYMRQYSADRRLARKMNIPLAEVRAQRTGVVVR